MSTCGVCVPVSAAAFDRLSLALRPEELDGRYSRKAPIHSILVLRLLLFADQGGKGALSS